MANKKRLAIIGSGISGLSTAYHLHNDYQITVFEKEDYFGGHTDTHQLLIDGQAVNVDSGFIIFCTQFYPNFCGMLKELGVESQPTDMSFSAYNRKSNVVYNATNPNKLFCQRRNLFSLSFYRMIFDILRFYNTAKKVLKSNDTETTVAEYLKQKKYSKAFIDNHLLPMISALWSATPERVSQFPIHHLVDFFCRHGLMQILNRPQWQVVKNGSSRYVKALREQLNVNWKSGSAVTKISRGEHIKVLTLDGNEATFDAVVMALHADSALAILDQASDNEQQILSAIPFEKNHVVVHTDDSIMHPNTLSWASWNTEVPNDFDSNTQRVCTANYWMNSLQGLKLKSNVFTSLNSQAKIDGAKILLERVYYHPVFTATSVAAQKKKHLIDGKQSTYFTGAYWGWGFHEDGAKSAADVSHLIRSQIP
jgi:predicted NAD/FAD-binding protein